MKKKHQKRWKSSEELMEKRDDGETVGKDEGHSQNEKSLTEKNKNSELEEEALHFSSL